MRLQPNDPRLTLLPLHRPPTLTLLLFDYLKSLAPRGHLVKLIQVELVQLERHFLEVSENLSLPSCDHCVLGPDTLNSKWDGGMSESAD